MIARKRVLFLLRTLMMWSLPLTVVSWVFHPTALLAQTTMGTIRGVATDESKGALPGDTVTVTHIKTGISQAALTDEAGRYAVVSLPALLAVADATLLKDPATHPFDWGEGVLMHGMMQAYKTTGNRKYLEYVQKWADFHCDQGIGRYLSVLPLSPAQGQEMGIKHPDRPGNSLRWMGATPMLMLYQETDQKKYLEAALQVADFILHSAGRTADGGLAGWIGSKQIWVDTLFMASPLLAKASKLTGDGQYLAEDIRQLQLFARQLQNPRTGLYYHRWDEATGKTTSEFWARGNGWVIMSMVDTLEFTDRKSKTYKRLHKLFLAQLEGLLKVQDASGGWHTVVDRPDSYLESSATAMIVYAIEKAIRLGIIGKKYRRCARKGSQFLMTKVTPEGQFIGASAGTRAGDFQSYQAIAVGSFTWGTGAFLLASCEALRSQTGSQAPGAQRARAAPPERGARPLGR